MSQKVFSIDDQRSCRIHANHDLRDRSTGGATVKTPENGWPKSTPALASIFAQTVLRDNFSPTTSRTSAANSSSTNTNAPGSKPDVRNSHHSPIGAIAGGIIGGVILLSLLTLGAFIVNRRRKPRRIYMPDLSTDTRMELHADSALSELHGGNSYFLTRAQQDNGIVHELDSSHERRYELPSSPLMYQSKPKS